MSIPCWHELATPQPTEAVAFYRALFGWDETPGNVGFPYHFLKRPEEAAPFGGMMQAAPGMPPHWMVYFAVPDLEAALATVTQQGGQSRHPIVSMPQGRFAVVADPHGATFALYQANRA